jgi:hypothetical protein
MDNDNMEYDIPLKLKQPDRSIPDLLYEEEFKDEYEEEQLYIQSIVNKSNNCINFFEPKKNNIKKIKEKNNDTNKKPIKIIPNEISINKLGSRQFNPRLPFPDKKHVIEKKEVYNILDDFPAL